MPSAGGDAVQLTHGGGANPQASPDGRTVYYLKGELQTRVRSEPGLWQVSADGGEETRLFDLRVDGGNWTVSPRGIYFFTPLFEQQKYVLDFFDFATRQTSQIKTIDSPRSTFLMSGMTLSPDEKWVAYGQRDKLSFDLMLVENFH
jgi:Tol biopolymer transport system component